MTNYDFLVSKDISALSMNDALDFLGSLIDLSTDLKRTDGTTKALEWCEILRTRNPSPQELVSLDYFESNAWSNRQHENSTEEKSAWHWHQPEVRKQILLLRRAVASPAFSSLHKLFRCQILTNLANTLNFIGRFVEAVGYWDQALLIEPKFAMAQGNRAYGLYHYAQSLYDHGHAGLFLKFSHDGFSASLDKNAIYEATYPQSIKEDFLSYKNHLANFLGKDFIEEPYNLANYPLGRSREEKDYRARCLLDRLFLNPLNDLGTHTIAAQDILTLPSVHTNIDIIGPPRIIGFFNQMKQEYVSARWLFVNGIETYGTPHYSDKNVLLYNMLDYSNHSLSCEKIKMSYRAAYSIFDKISYFLNFYLNLGMKEKSINFRKVWYKKNNDLHDTIASLENWPLRGLFWLSHDLFDDELQDVASPEAKELHEIRNHLEHKHFNVHEFLLDRNMGIAPDGDIGFSITRSDLEEKTLHILRLARAALIYLSLGIHVEERRHRRDDDILYAKMFLFTMDDKLKL